MSWLLLVLVLGLLILVGVAAVAVIRRPRTDPPADSDAEDFLTEYFALEEFDDNELRERLEHLRGVPDLR
jgi:uncharacterized membrane protein